MDTVCFNFDESIDRIGSHSKKWDTLHSVYGLDPREVLPMWVADMEFKPPESVQEALKKSVDHGVYGYFGDESDYLNAIVWWLHTRYQWTVNPQWIFTTHGLVNGAALCIEAFTDPGDGVVLLTPTYYSFYRILRPSTRQIVECPLRLDGGRYTFDCEAYSAQMTGREKLLILCSPQNPGGQVWTKQELQNIADFAQKHQLILVSDEIHADLVYPGYTHRSMAVTVPEISNRLVVMTSSTKTFNIAGAHLGNVIISDPGLHARFAQKIETLGISPGAFGPAMVTAAYSPEGAAWLHQLVAYLDENRRIFCETMNGLKGVSVMPLEATYLSWVDFSKTGLSPKACVDLIENKAKIAAFPGHHFGKGGEGFVRFNIACTRAQVKTALERLGNVFS